MIFCQWCKMWFVLWYQHLTLHIISHLISLIPHFCKGVRLGYVRSVPPQCLLHDISFHHFSSYIFLIIPSHLTTFHFATSPHIMFIFASEWGVPCSVPKGCSLLLHVCCCIISHFIFPLLNFLICFFSYQFQSLIFTIYSIILYFGYLTYIKSRKMM